MMSSTSQPRSDSWADNDSVAMSARGTKTRLMGSRTSSKAGKTSARAAVDCSPVGTRSGRTPCWLKASTVESKIAAMRNPE